MLQTALWLESCSTEQNTGSRAAKSYTDALAGVVYVQNRTQEPALTPVLQRLARVRTAAPGSLLKTASAATTARASLAVLCINTTEQ